MKKLVAFVVIGGALVAGLPSPASAQPVIVTLQCTIFGSALPRAQFVYGLETPTGVTPPAACTAQNATCAACASAILSLPPVDGNRFFMFQTFTVDQAITGYAGPYFVFQRQ